MAEKLTLESPVVQEAKKIYEASVKTYLHPVPFDTLFEKLKTGDSIEAIAAGCGVPTYTVNYLWLRYFRSWLGKERSDGRKATRKNYTQRGLLKQEAALPEKCGLRIVAERARSLGCDVELLRKHGSYILLHALNIESCGVAVYEVNAAMIRRDQTSNPIAYFTLSRASLMRREFVALIINVKKYPVRIFLLESSKLLTAYFKGKGVYQLKITVDRPRYHRIVVNRKLNMWDFEGDAVDSLLLNLKKTRAG